MTRYSLKKNKT